MAFNPSEHMMPLKGKDYLQVMWRLVWFREEHPDYCIDTQALTIDQDHAVFKAIIRDAESRQVCAGHGSESRRDFGDFIEKAETKAVGRALAMLGYGTQFAADELDEGERIVDSPVKRKSEPENRPETPARVQTTGSVPQTGKTRVQRCNDLQNRLGLSNERMKAIRVQLVKAGLVVDKPSSEMSEAEFTGMLTAIEANFAEQSA